MRIVAMAIIAILFIVIGAFVAYQSFSGSTMRIESLSPKQAVETYFTAWSDKDYKTMYSLLSDSHKKSEPTAADYNAFAAEMGRYYWTAENLTLIKVYDVIISGNSAVAYYQIRSGLKNGSQSVETNFYHLVKQADGWKIDKLYAPDRKV